jgi:ubiquinol-cytochrome c reductase cytochrome c subunit
MGQGGIGTGFAAPALGDVTAKEIGEAIRVGPYLMPKFSERRLSDADVNAIAAYVLDVVADPPNRGGWGIGNIGPIPEGLVAFLLAGGALLVVARIIGERTPA